MGRNDLCFCGSGKKHKKCHSDINSESAFAKMIELHNKTDELIKENAQFDKLKCKKGCAECCYQNFSISTVEFYYLIYKIYTNYGIERVNEYFKKGYEMWIEYEKKYPKNAEFYKLNTESIDKYKSINNLKLINNLSDKSPMYNEFPCPFLNLEEKSCGVYEDRPFICRHYGLGYLEKYDSKIAFCEKTADGDTYQDYMADLRSILDDTQEMDLYYSKKYNQVAYDRSFPIFYYCKINYLNPNKFLDKIKELKDIPKDKCSENRIYRVIQRHSR